MAISLRQSANSGWMSGTVGSFGATLGSTPTPGNVLLFTYTGMTYLASPFAYMSLPSGSTLSGQNNVIYGSSDTYMQLNMSYRVVQSGDSKTWSTSSPTGSTSPSVQAIVGCGLNIREINIDAGYNPVVASNLITYVQGDSLNPMTGPNITPAEYSALCFGCGVGFTPMSSTTDFTLTQSYCTPTTGWTTDVVQVSGSIYGEQDDVTLSSVSSGSVSMTGCNYSYVNGANIESCFGLFSVSEVPAPNTSNFLMILGI